MVMSFLRRTHVFEGPHLAAVADATHEAFPFLDIRTLSKGVEFESMSGFYYRLMLRGGSWFFDWSRTEVAGPYATSAPHPVARRGDDPQWAVANVAEALLITTASPARSSAPDPVAMMEREGALRALRFLSRSGNSEAIRMSARSALGTE